MKKHIITLIIILSAMNIYPQEKFEGIENNPLVKEWATPFETPPFSEIKNEDYLPAFKYAMEKGRREIYHLKQVKQKPNFKNTIVALENTGALLNRISGVFYNMIYCNSTPELQKIAQEVAPLMTEYENDISLDKALFERVKAVYENPGELTGEERMLLEKTYKSFVRSGANLSDADKETYRKLTTELSTLTLKFSENVLAATNAYTKVVTDKELLKGIPENALAIAREKAKKKGTDGWLFDLSQPSYLAILTDADNRDLRKEFYLKYNTKAYKDNFDNQKIIKQILKDRYELAKLLGYENYAAYALEERMAENTRRVYELENELLKYSLPAMEKEIADLTAFAHSTGFEGKIERWDFSYYSNKHKISLYDVNDEMLKPYFKLENVIDGVFSLAETLFGLKFVSNSEIDIYHKDVKVYEVYRNGKFMAVLYLDFYPRDTKKGGAWMTTFRDQKKTANGEVRPLVSLVMNFTPSTEDKPSLLTFDEVRTFMHEFGHATHAMMSDVTYSSLSGTSVPRDFVELPSQLLENWATEKEFLDKFAFHYETGETIPDTLIEKIRKADNYHAGYASCRQISFGLLDMMWHTTEPEKIKNILKAERSVFDKMEAMPVVKGTCMSTSFSHIFAGGYAAGYYGYKWAEVLEADIFSVFKEKGIFNKALADSYIKNILSKGGTAKPMELYINFLGREPKTDALLKRSGLK
ncbi:MAG: M3 family metallopeptidase [Bacteroidales bacterium]|nr:M3 family metallopeptidase [Bacteroidales bacterium]